MLMDRGRVPIDGRETLVRCHVEHFDFSGHAGHSELVRFAEGCQPETIVLCHSDQPQPLIEDLESVARRVIAPTNGEAVRIP